MQRVQQCAGHEILGPNHACGPDQESSANASQTKTRELRGDDEESTKPIIKRDVVVELGYDDGIHGVWGTNGDVCHDEDENMLLDIPGAGVEREFQTAQPSRETIGSDWEDEGREFSNGITYDQKRKGRDTRGRLSEVEEGIQ